MIFSRFYWNKTSFLELTKPKCAYIYFRTKRLNLLTGFSEVYPIEDFLKYLESIKIQTISPKPLVFHFYYEFGLILSGLGHSVKDEDPIAIEIEYEKKRFKKKPKSKLNNIPLKSIERPTWSEYKIAFNHIQEQLGKGNCYQANLTYPFDFETESVIDPREIADFFFSLEGLSPYAHATFLGDEMILSNSPECLFQYRPGELFTMPIKGTMNLSKDWKSDWGRMLKDLKEEGELNMITDLLRNDLNRLQMPVAKVIKKRSPLIVPGLLHQYSLISVKLNGPLSLLKTIESLFPGGSVTGAPKKRVMEILQNTERYSRGIYCGSTLLCIGDRKIANINIRTMAISVSERLWRYGAGGGITLLSRPVNEFQELESKVASFLTLLKAPGYRGKV